MSLRSDALSGLTPQQRAVLELRLRERARTAGVDRIAPRPPGDALELSFAQERLWFVEQLQSAGAANHIPITVRIEGPLPHARLEASLTALVERHAVLRCAIDDAGGKPAPRLETVGRISVPVVDVPGATLDDRIQEARRLAALEAERPFDLAVAPLLRAALFRLGPDDVVLSVVVHHIAADGWSVGVLGRELGALYDAGGDRRALPPLDIQHADFAAWQRRIAATPRSAASLDWWRARLAGMPVLELPTDYPRPAVATTAGARASTRIPQRLVASLARIGVAHGATMFMTLEAALAARLMRWTGTTDIAIGSPVAGRGSPDVEGLVGPFVNTIVLRTSLDGHPTFRDLLTRTRELVSGALAHQDVPFERIVDEVQTGRSLSHAPLTPAVFAFQNVPPATLALGGLLVTAFEIERRTARFDFCLFAVESADGIDLSAEYRIDLFRPSTIDRLLQSYVCLLERVVENPDVRVEDVSLLTPGESAALAIEWKQDVRRYPREASVPALVEARAVDSPDATALTDGTRQLSYFELERAANHIARALAARGVSRGDRVGVCLDRSVDLVAVLLGVMKAGAAYVPLDPSFPRERLRYMASDAGVRVIVVSPRLEALASGIAESHHVVDSLETDVEAAPIRVTIEGDDLAYITYTSGSTGVPKGVEVRHQSVIRLLCGVDYVDLGSSHTLLQMAPVAFDASTFEIWGALVHGGRLVLYPGGAPRFDELAELLARERVDTVWLTSSLYNACIDADAAMLGGVGQLLVGGEALSMEHVRRGREALPGTRLVNGYGPTEGTTFTCCHTIQQADVADGRLPVPIGGPIANTRVYVLDRWLEPVPAGLPGELFIGGDGLARGYTRAPALTAERFVPDAISGEPGARLYRTGDLVRRRDDGALEYLGRRDQQVKIRGYRIELGEIEAALAAHSFVRSAAVVVQTDEARGKTLVAYIVTGGESVDEAELRSDLATRLPEYMIPAFILVIDALPRTANGKIDREALPRVQAPAGRGGGSEPANDVEAIVVATCRELLNAPHAGLDDGFFELGGHSLLATQFAARLQRAFQIDVRVRTIFEAPTLGALADVILDALLADDEIDGALDGGVL